MKPIKLTSAQYEKATEVIDNWLDQPRSAICPLFRPIRDSIEQFASGVFIKIGPAKFLLTVAHATDEQDILIPGRSCLLDLAGHFFYTRTPASGNRADDRYDIAFIRLDDTLISDIHTDFSFLDAPDCDLTDATSTGEAYSIIGYPARKSKMSGKRAETSLSTFTCSGLDETSFFAMGFSTAHHLLVRFRRKKAADVLSGNRTIPCLPHGMSGGGVFAWSKKLPDISEMGPPKLVGIVQEYYSSKDIFVGTRLNCFIRCIKAKFPELPISE